MPTYLRRTLFSLCLAVFSFSLLTLPWAHLATVTILNRDVVKSWLDKSGANNKLADFMVESTKMNSGDSQEAFASQDPRINQIYQAAIAPTFSSENVNKTVDGVYDWLSGKTETLKLTSDLQSIKQRLADELSKYAAEKIRSLPACTPEQMATLVGTQIDPWSATCVPPGTDPAQVQTDLKNQILTSKDFTGTKTAATDNTTAPTQDIQQNIKGIQSAYQFALIGPLVFGTTAVLSAVAAVFLSSSRRKGLQRVSITFFTSGAITGFSALAMHFGFDALAHMNNEFVSGIAIVISGDVIRVLTIWSISLVVVGAASFAILWYLGRQNQPTTAPPAKKVTAR